MSMDLAALLSPQNRRHFSLIEAYQPGAALAEQSRHRMLSALQGMAFQAVADLPSSKLHEGRA